MSVNDESSASRQFVASCAAYSSKWIKGTRYWQVGYSVFFAVVVALGLLGVFGRLWGVHLRFPHIGAAVVYGVLVGMMVVGVGMAAYLFCLFWRSRRKHLITATGDGLTIDRRRGDICSLVDAALGLWVDMGVAVHLHCGRHRFVLGRRRLAVGVRLR